MEPQRAELNYDISFENNQEINTDKIKNTIKSKKVKIKRDCNKEKRPKSKISRKTKK